MTEKMNPVYDRSLTLRAALLGGMLGAALAMVGCTALPAGSIDESSGGFASFGKADSARPEFNPELCAYDETDPYEPRARFQVGPWTGECLDTQRRRPVAVLASPTQDERTLELANVFHDHGWWYASIPVDAIEEVYFQLEYFPAIVPAGHTQIRIEFNQPVRLSGHSDWNYGQEEETYNLVLSAEAVPRVGDGYDLFRGLRDHFGLALRVTTLEARYDSMIVEQEHHVEQWRLMLTEEEQRDLLTFYANESEELGLGITYHTITRNCTTEIVRSLDGVVEYGWRERVGRFFLRATEFYPNIVRAALVARGLLPLDQSTDWYALEEDPTFPRM